MSRRLSDLLDEKPRRAWLKGWPARIALIAALLLLGAFLLSSLKPQGNGSALVKAAVLRNPTLDRGITFGEYLDRKHISGASYMAADLARRPPRRSNAGSSTC